MASTDDQNDTELAKLLQEIETMAKDFVRSVGGYPPFGAMIDKKGQVTLLVDQAMVGGGGGANIGQKVLEMVKREAAPPSIRAAALANMGYMKDQTSGQNSVVIVLSLHHRTGRCVDVAIPFSKSASGAVRFGESVVGIGKTKLF
jgi:hypothetical protein